MENWLILNLNGTMGEIKIRSSYTYKYCDINKHLGGESEKMYLPYGSSAFVLKDKNNLDINISASSIFGFVIYGPLVIKPVKNTVKEICDYHRFLDYIVANFEKIFLENVITK
jgi:hypothetical protein